MISRGKRLSLQLIGPAVKLAEAHLRERSSPSKAANKAAAAAVPGKEEQKDEPRGHHAARRDRQKIR